MSTNYDKSPLKSGIHHIAVQTADMEGSLRLYRDILEMPVVTEFGRPGRRIVLLAAGNGSHVELSAAEERLSAVETAAVAPPLRHVALTVADVGEVIERVRAAGYEVTVEPKAVQLGPLRATIAFFRGAAGELVELFQTEAVSARANNCLPHALNLII